MVDSIKITALQDIGANIAYTTLVPLVNMAGTPTTQKANLQILGNLFLNGAGGSYFARAAQANLALSVANAAQPNITSVGTLTSLTVTGNITAANINGGNIVVANFYYGDGGFLTNVTSNGSYSNSNVANYLPTYTGNVGAGNVNVTGTVYANGLSSTGLASLTVLTVSTTANLGAANNITITGGTSGQKLTTNGNGVLSWTDDANSSYGDSNVTSLLGAFGSNTITTTGNANVGNIGATNGVFFNVSGNGSALSAITGANVSGAVAFATTASAVAGRNVSGQVGNALVAGTVYTNAQPNITSVGTLTSLAVTGNVTANNFTGNGGGLSNVATKVEGSWTLVSGNNTVSLSVPGSGTYSLWINGNIPNGIVTYTATAVVTNTNVPVLGEQYGWYYPTGNALVLTSLPNQFVGTPGVISNTESYLGNAANVFTFGITNNSGNTAVVNYGYTKL
jgi:hypothetical protein